MSTVIDQNNGDSKIKVFLRARSPEPSSELIEFDLDEDDENTVFIRDPEAPSRNSTFRFDRIFWTSTNQELLFDEMGKPLIDGLFNGQNGSCLSYGETGSGKTYSIFGAEAGISRGLIPRTIELLFEKISSTQSTTTVVSCSFYEIYNDRIRDLGRSYSMGGVEDVNTKTTGPLANRRTSNASDLSATDAKIELIDEVKHAKDDYQHMTLEIQEDSNGNSFIKDLKIIPITTPEEAISVITLGIKMRALAEAKVNQVASRAHTVFSIHFEQKSKNSSNVLNFVDLAGSEKIKKTEWSLGIRITEALHISTSLGALGKVISGWDSKHTHINYKESKLTRLLQPSLGNDSNAFLLANVNPSKTHYSECMSTLQFAHHCHVVKAHLHTQPSGNVNSNNNNSQISAEKEKKLVKLQQELKATQEELQTLRTKTAQMEKLHTASGSGFGLGSSTAMLFPLTKVVKLLQLVGVNASIASNGTLGLPDGRTFRAEQMDLVMDQASAGEDSPGKPLSKTVKNAAALLRGKSMKGSSMIMDAANVAVVNSMKKELAVAQAETEQLRNKIAEKKHQIDSLGAQLKEANNKVARYSANATHLESDMKHHIEEAERQRKDLQATLEAKFAEEKKELLRHQDEIIRKQFEAVQAIPSNLRTFTQTVRENEDIKTYNDTLLQKKYEKRWQQCEQSHAIELSNLKLQYEHFIAEKNRDLVEFKDKFNQYKGRKTHQLKVCEREIVLLYEYVLRLEEILRNAEQGNYAVQQRGAADGMPVTGLYQTGDFSSSGPLRLGGILLPRGVRPVNPLDTTANGEALNLAKKLLKKSQDTASKMKQMQDAAFEKTLGKVAMDGNEDGPIEEVLQKKIRSLFQNSEHIPAVGISTATNQLHSSVSTSMSSSSANPTGVPPVGSGMVAVRRVSMIASIGDNDNPSNDDNPAVSSVQDRRVTGTNRPSTSHETGRDRTAAAALGTVSDGWTANVSGPGPQSTNRPSSSAAVGGGTSASRKVGNVQSGPSHPTVSFSETSDADKRLIEKLNSQLATLRDEVEELRARDSERQLELREVMQELEGNDTLEYIGALEANQDRLQAQLREANAQIMASKAAQASLVRLSQKQDSRGRVPAKA